MKCQLQSDLLSSELSMFCSHYLTLSSRVCNHNCLPSAQASELLCPQVFYVSVITSTLFFRTTISPNSVNDGNLYMGVLFFSLIFMMFNGFSEMSIMVSGLLRFTSWLLVLLHYFQVKQ
jgi:hypothetical protein